MKTGLWLAGGLCSGIGIILAVNGFGMEVGPTATNISKLGWDALPELSILNNGALAVLMFFGGIGLMAAASATAYKETGGY